MYIYVLYNNRSLSKREVSIYAGRPGHYDFKMAQLRFRQETGFNTYAGGGAFLVTDSENRSDHIMSFRMTADKV